jgi:D-alanine-D-alanine ligase
MAKKKLRIGILFGGRSGEHEISLLSAASILKAIDRKKYEIVPLGITKQGQWVRDGEAQRLLTGEPLPALAELAAEDDSELAIAAAVIRSGETLSIPAPRPHAPQSFATIDLVASADASLATPAPSTNALGVDIVFPVLHGTFGEDGTIQGLFEMADVAYVGSGVLGSSVSMDKAVMKRLFAAAGLPQTPHLAMLRSEWHADPKRCTRLIEKALAYPVFVKPANLGSSVGISKVHGRGELAAAMDLAASFDRKLIIEQGVGGPGVKPRELEVAVLGNDTPEASVVGEIVPGAEFYDYDAKYHSDDSVAIIPAKLSKAEERQVREMAVAAFRACECSGLARVDFLMEPKRKGQSQANGASRIYLNEINTMPGFTKISMYPKLWAASGVPYRKLIDRLIELAVERDREKMQTSFTRG